MIAYYRACIHWLVLASLLGLSGCGEERLFDPDAFEAVPSFDQQDFSQIAPAESTEYWELHFRMGGAFHRIVDSGGSLSREELPDSLHTILDSVAPYPGFGVGCMPSFCHYYLAVIQNGALSTIRDAQGLRRFLGRVDNEVEALLIVKAEGYYWGGGVESGAIRRVSGGFEVVALRLVYACAPFRTDRILLRVDADSGNVKRLRSEIWEYDKESCI
jgi:hypothetical protein